MLESAVKFMAEITRYPLCWPDNVARTAPQNRTYPKFELRTLDSASKSVLQEINRLNKRRWDQNDASVIISSNLRLRQDGLPASGQLQPQDTGIAVFFKLRFSRNGKWHERPCVLTCDKWNKVEYNLIAIAKDIEAQRARERWGCSTIEQSFQGYLAIPEKTGGGAWWEILEVKPTASQLEVVTAWKQKCKISHPDTGGSQDAMVKLQNAYDQAMAQFRGNG